MQFTVFYGIFMGGICIYCIYQIVYKIYNVSSPRIAGNPKYL